MKRDLYGEKRDSTVNTRTYAWVKRQRGEPIWGKKSDREAKARSKHGIPDDTRIWTAENGWVTHKDELITGKITITPAQLNRAGDGFSGRQEMIFTKDDETDFIELRNELERNWKLGVIGTLPDPARIPAADLSVAPEPAGEEDRVTDQEFRTKYNIPSDAVLARSQARGMCLLTITT